MEQGQLFKPTSLVASPRPEPGKVQLSPEMKLSEALLAFEIDQANRGLKVRTSATYRRDVRFLIRFVGDLPVKDMDGWKLKEFGAWLRARKTRRGPVAEKTVGRTITAVRSLFAFLFGEKVLRNNPAYDTLLPTDAESEVERPLKETDVRAAFQAWAQKPKWYAMGSFLIHGGLLRNEVLALKTSDVDLSNRFKPEIVVVARSPYKVRRVDLPADFAPAYETYVREAELGDEAVLFPFSERYANMMLEEMGRAAGMKRTLTGRLCFNTFLAQCVKKNMKDEEICRALCRPPGAHSHRLLAKLHAIRQMV